MEHDQRRREELRFESLEEAAQEVGHNARRARPLVAVLGMNHWYVQVVGDASQGVVVDHAGALGVELCSIRYDNQTDDGTSKSLAGDPSPSTSRNAPNCS